MTSTFNRICIGLSLIGVGSLAACSEESSLGGGGAGPEGTRVPTTTVDDLAITVSDDPESPFSSEVFRAGLTAWRTPHPEGACASCHSADAYDLAFFNYTDSVILRRALGIGASIDDAHAIVDMVHYLRERHDIEAPVNPDVPFLQPGGALAPGKSMAARDLNMYLLLRERGLRLFQPEKIRTIEEAIAAREELLHLDLRTVRIGMPVNKWTSDVFRSERHRTIQKWIPEFPRHPKEGMEKEWYELQNAYIEAPSPVTLWAFVDASPEMTDDLGFLSQYYVNAEGKEEEAAAGAHRTKAAVYARRYRSVQIGAHMMRTNNTKLPDFEPTQDSERLWTDFKFVDDMQDIAHDRITTFWDTGSGERGSRQASFLENTTDKFLSKITRGRDKGDISANHSFESVANQVTWMWQGMVYDPALQLSAAGNDAEYFYEQTGSLSGDYEKWAGNHVNAGARDLAFHRQFMGDAMWVHASFGRDTRYDAKALNIYTFYNKQNIGCRGSQFEGTLGENYPGGSPPGYESEYVRYVANGLRMRMLSHLDYLRRFPLGPEEQCKDGIIQAVEWLAAHESQEDFDQISPAINELLVLLGERDETFDYGKHQLFEALPEEEATRLQREGNFLSPARHEDLPLMFPEGARDPLPAGPISPVFDAKCAGCHGAQGEGGPTGGEDGGPYPPLRGVNDYEAFKTVVRDGLLGSQVPMPWFTQDQISDDELKEIFDALQ